VPFSFGRVTLVPALPSFYEQYPNISVELSFSDGPIDLVAEGYDVAVRTGDGGLARLSEKNTARRRPNYPSCRKRYRTRRG
jgi:DNA-binding transcriptional LysR family regulator